ncbi:MAG: hypothetical protein AAB381_01655 [Patescibacteria group bacterium]
MNNKKIIGIVVAVIVIAIIGFLVYKKAPASTPADPNTAEAQAEMEAIVAKVGKLIDLPTGENPTVATITDPEKLKDQPFFANAKSGHKVLIYPTARKAFLYDESRNKLIEVAPLILGNPDQLTNTPTSTQ